MSHGIHEKRRWLTTECHSLLFCWLLPGGISSEEPAHRLSLPGDFGWVRFLLEMQCSCYPQDKQHAGNVKSKQVIWCHHPQCHMCPAWLPGTSITTTLIVDLGWGNKKRKTCSPPAPVWWRGIAWSWRKGSSWPRWEGSNNSLQPGVFVPPLQDALSSKTLLACKTPLCWLMPVGYTADGNGNFLKWWYNSWTLKDENYSW